MRKSNGRFGKKFDPENPDVEVQDMDVDSAMRNQVVPGPGETAQLMKPVGVKEHLLHQMSPTNKNFSDFWYLQQEWSQATFGTDKERGPAGPIAHLMKEVIELTQDPTDIMEYVDCIFLIVDAARRQGYSFYDVMDGLFLKLKQNVMRKWDVPKKDRAVEHVRKNVPPSTSRRHK